MNKRSLLLAAVLTMAASPALAHTAVGHTSGLMSGFTHPIGGLDHILAMVAVGILAIQLGGKSLWTVPAAFVGMMIVGGLLGISGLALPFVELGIAGSVVILGFVVALGRKMPMAAAMTLVGALAIFHGHAHGTEMPVDANGIGYGLGFAAATVLLHLAGIVLGKAAGRASAAYAPLAVRVAGGFIGGMGLSLLAA
ncbi:HupE/UreJ family protein [Sneathiella chinensis]|uniref:Protein hupE n=1 Tax=Sneathiella chinensis TaxID=349750 RepID=A0ABQ5U5U3_9PROT|nr:HupE/UreJ family protein [Sneathiella chinensis]GLQ07274.1 protein hupE [Sneathiella chinensis]